jgi:asparagine synthase (glutamine-hydrolysing)
MCGIALIAGSGPDPRVFRQMLDALKPRGEIEETWSGDGLLAGTQRLAIVDPRRAAQPWLSADGRWLLCYNGEVFNYRSLRRELARLGHQFRSDSDTEVVAEAFRHWGVHAVRRMRGEFAFVLADLAEDRVYLARDPIGVKPLYWSVRAGCIHVASEIKALVPVGATIREVPAGRHGWAEGGKAPQLTAYSDLLSVRGPALGNEVLYDADEAAALVRMTLADSIKVRADTDLPIGVILSGGLDSSLTLLHVHALRPDCIAFTIGAPGSADLEYASKLTADLGVRHEIVELSQSDIKMAEIRDAIRISELTEYGDIINAVVSVPLFRRVAETGVRVVLTGDGSDELFGGYPMYDQISADQQRRLFLHKLANLGRTELQRVDRTSMAHAVETRVPFLDPGLVKLAMRLPMSMKVRGGTEKWILRRAFTDILPEYVLRRPKNPMSHSSGLHERARIYKPFFAKIHRSFGYDLHEPVRRDFSVVLDRCGHDLDQAIALASARSDYTPREHARDMAGAARWNAKAMVARRG